MSDPLVRIRELCEGRRTALRQRKAVLDRRVAAGELPPDTLELRLIDDEAGFLIRLADEVVRGNRRRLERETEQTIGGALARLRRKRRRLPFRAI
jgi:hypothetical protein